MARPCGSLAPSLGVLMLLCLTQAASGLPRRQSPELSSSGSDAYILSHGTGFFSTNLSLDALGVVKERLSGDFLWIRRAGKVYRIQDEATLDQAQALFAPLRDLDPEREALARRQSRLEADQEALEREQDEVERELDRLTDQEENGERPTSAVRQSLERRQRDLEPRVRALETRERELEAVERSIDESEDALEKKAEAKLWHLIDKAIASGVARPDENR